MGTLDKKIMFEEYLEDSATYSKNYEVFDDFAGSSKSHQVVKSKNQSPSKKFQRPKVKNFERTQKHPVETFERGNRAWEFYDPFLDERFLNLDIGDHSKGLAITEHNKKVLLQYYLDHHCPFDMDMYELLDMDNHDLVQWWWFETEYCTVQNVFDIITKKVRLFRQKFNK